MLYLARVSLFLFLLVLLVFTGTLGVLEATFLMSQQPKY